MRLTVCAEATKVPGLYDAVFAYGTAGSTGSIPSAKWTRRFINDCTSCPLSYRLVMDENGSTFAAADTTPFSLAQNNDIIGIPIDTVGFGTSKIYV